MLKINTQRGIFTTEFWLVSLMLVPEIVSNFVQLYQTGVTDIDRGDFAGLALVGVYAVARTAAKYIPVIFTKYFNQTEAPETQVNVNTNDIKG